jgi:hypothetical protein
MLYDALPEVATAKSEGTAASAQKALDAMSTAYKTATAVTPSTDSGKAKAQLAGLTGDPEWRAAFLRGSPEHRRQFAELTAAAASGSAAAEALAGDPVALPGTPELSSHGVTPTQLRREIGALRTSGLNDDVIAQILNGHEVNPGEVAAARELKSMLLGDRQFVAKYLANDWNAVRQMRLIATILSGTAA